MDIRNLLFSIVIPVACISLPVRADVILHATNNGTIQPAGPRTGSNGKRFFNMEGSANGNFASFGVIDFALPSAINDSFNALTLSLTQDNAAFTNPGSLSFYVVTDTTTSIDPNSSPFVFEASNLPGGVGTQLGTKYLLGTGSFTGLPSGTQGTTDSYSFVLSGLAATYVNQEVHSGGPIRILVAPNDPTVAATYAGYTDNLAGPALQLNSVPEPSTLGLLLVFAPVSVFAFRSRFRS